MSCSSEPRSENFLASVELWTAPQLNNLWFNKFLPS